MIGKPVGLLLAIGMSLVVWALLIVVIWLVLR
jgi:hypothetical protein